jgi:hypothetical protein
MRTHRKSLSLVSLLAIVALSGASAGAKPPKAKSAPQLKLYTNPDHVDADFGFQGEYAGTVEQPDGAKTRLGGQVRALGEGVFRTMFYPGGLPGDGWDEKTIVQIAPSTDDSTPEDAKLVDGKVMIDQVYKGKCDGRSITGTTDKGLKFKLQRVHRHSPTLGAKPPAGALVLFDGSDTKEWLPGAKVTPQKWLIGGATTRRTFQDFKLHVEFMISYVPQTRAIWNRPNSGVYLQRRYEIQVLDSFGIVERTHDCGVLYAQYTPTVNMCYPPLTWQTYDIDFTAARYDAAGKKTKLGRVTLVFNGVKTIDDVEIKQSTPGGMAESPAPAGIYLQEHGLPAFYKNVWVVEKRP